MQPDSKECIGTQTSPSPLCTKAELVISSEGFPDGGPQENGGEVMKSEQGIESPGGFPLSL
jgi:hypothetical protein